ncbi:S-layer homology domain-containing protein [Cellulosilyticum ruminicola]|uniref:S-layer homology domain-containing protein n=1 Tax=Cellulosilyticum ruminicola TaxID=425254 RepID=UPI0006D24154|nr:S-layer homology domain-containing protein [Cellulosilyticum ruminicola]
MDKLLLIHQIETMKLGRSTINLYFKNVNMAEHPYVGSIASKLQIKTLKNLADKQLGETLTRQELAQIIYEVTENKLVLNHDDVHIGDIQDNSYEPALIYAVQAGLMELDGENISPAKAVTKGEMVQVLMKLNKAIKTQKEAEAKAKIEAAQNITSPEQDPLAVKAGTSTNTDQTSSGQDQFNRRTAE